MDHTEGTYAAAELLHRLFERVVIITPRDTVATLASLVTRQGILRRLNELRIRTLVLAEPQVTESFSDGRLAYVNVYNGDPGMIDEIAFFAWSTPRAPNDELYEPLRECGLDVHRIGDAKCARDVLSATAEGHAIGGAL
jgi:hypothetical protein